MKAVAAGGIEDVMKAISTHIDNADTCKFGCGGFNNITINSKI